MLSILKHPCNIGMKVVDWFGCAWVFPYIICWLIQEWGLSKGSARGNVMWKSFLAVLWVLWKEKNSRCFEGKSLTMDRFENSQISGCITGLQSSSF